MRSIPGFVNYYASKEGIIYKRTGKHYRPVTMFIQPYSKYLSVYLTTKKYTKYGIFVHKLIALAYFGKHFTKYEIFHRDKNFLNNAPKNLTFKKYKSNKCISDTNKNFAIKDYEMIFKRLISFDEKNIFWKRYSLVKAKGNPRNTYNWLYLFLKSRNEI